MPKIDADRISAVSEESSVDLEQVELEAPAEESVERAKPDGLKVGDFVQWESSGGTARGQIDRIERDGQIDVPNADVVINGTEDDPAALITVFREGEEGWEDTPVRVAHRFSTLQKISELRWMEGKYKRSESTAFDEIEDRTYEFPFSSEYPVARYFGNEILSHETKAADLSRLNDGAPLLFNHNPDRVIGVVERAYIDGKNAVVMRACGLAATTSRKKSCVT